MPIGSVQHLISDISYIQSLSLSLFMFLGRPVCLENGVSVLAEVGEWWCDSGEGQLIAGGCLSKKWCWWGTFSCHFHHTFFLFLLQLTHPSPFFWNHFINYLKDPDILAPPPWWKTLSPSKWINTDNFSTLYTLLKTAKTVIDSNLNIFPTRYVTI